ncbi:MAG: hypothetical protein ABW278_08430 [Steroidobacteraceae bacterium]
MQKPEDRPAIPAGPRTADDAGQKDNSSAFDPDAPAADGEAQSRDSEQALERALGRIPPG